MRRAAAASDRAAAPMEQAQADAAVARHLVQSPMGAENFPRAGEHAAVFVGVGVAQHDFLGVVPGGEQLAVARRAPQLTADARRVAQVLDGFEERHGHQARIAAATGDFHAAQPRQPDHGGYVLHRRRTADDVVPDRFGSASGLDFRDHAEGFDHVARARG